MYKRLCLFFLTNACFTNIFAKDVLASNNLISSTLAIPETSFIFQFESINKKKSFNSSSPYFNEEYKYATIKLKQGRSFNKVKTRIDLLTLTTYFLSSTGIEINIEPGNVKEITYADTTLSGILFYKFQTGFPSFEKQTENNIYLILAEGKCGLLELITKKVTETKNNFSGGTVYDYETFEDYFLFSKGALKRVKKDKDFILSELADKQPQLTDYIQTNKLNMKKPEHISRLISYYNTL